MVSRKEALTRRALLASAAAAAASSVLARRPARAASKAKLKIGLLLPFSGTYAPLGASIADGMKLAASEHHHRLGGREIEWAFADAESDATKARAKTRQLVSVDKVDILTGPVHSGVCLEMLAVVRETKTLTMVTNAGVQEATGSLCAPHVFRTSFSNWQTSYPCGHVMLRDGHRRVALMYWDYVFGVESMRAFKESFEQGGGTIVQEIAVPFPSEDFAPYLSRLDVARPEAMRPDGVFVFFAGRGAARFINDYAAAGLRDRIPLYGSGFLTEGVRYLQGSAAEGIKTTLHYADALDNHVNQRFRASFKKAYSREADVYAVAGYDTVNLLSLALDKVQGDTGAQAELIAALEDARLFSPRGRFRFSAAHNPIQNIYLRQIVGGRELFLGVAQQDAEDPATGCRMIAAR
jgi:branched-chain amino acid transport system substrate-binding protein